jgi:hypothetical protein
VGASTASAALLRRAAKGKKKGIWGFWSRG